VAYAFADFAFFLRFSASRDPGAAPAKESLPRDGGSVDFFFRSENAANSRLTQRAPTIRLTRDMARGPTFRAAASTSVEEKAGRCLSPKQAPARVLSLPCEHTRPWEGFLLPNDYQLSRNFCTQGIRRAAATSGARRNQRPDGQKVMTGRALFAQFTQLREDVLDELLALCLHVAECR